ELDPRELVVMADAADTESERTKRILGRLDDLQLLAGDLVEVGNPRGQARRGRLVPRRQAGAARQLTNFGLPEIDLVERAPDAELARRLAARTVVAAIVGVVPVDDHRAAPLRNRRQVRVELVLAEVTAVRGVGAIFRALELAGADDFVADREAAGDRDRHLTVAARITCAVGGHGDRTVAERVVGNPGEVGTVDAAAVGDDD